MKVTILNATAYRGKQLSPGEVVEVREKTANRWIQFRIAKGSSEEKPLSRMNKEELLQAAEKQGLSIPAGATNKEILALIEGGGEDE